MNCGHFYNGFGLRKSPLIPRMRSQESVRLGAREGFEGGSFEEGPLPFGRGKSCPFTQKGEVAHPG